MESLISDPKFFDLNYYTVDATYVHEDNAKDEGRRTAAPGHRNVNYDEEPLSCSHYLALAVMITTVVAIFLTMGMYRKLKIERDNALDPSFWVLVVICLCSGIIFIIHRIRTRAEVAARDAMAIPFPFLRTSGMAVLAIMTLALSGLLMYRRHLHTLHKARRKLKRKQLRLMAARPTKLVLEKRKPKRGRQKGHGKGFLIRRRKKRQIGKLVLPQHVKRKLSPKMLKGDVEKTKDKVLRVQRIGVEIP